MTTDFGVRDSYVAQMKGVILGLVPAAAVVDVTHEIPPQDVAAAAAVVADLADAFPPGTVHVAVVDPGVGSDRVILAVAAGGQFFVAPDNGLLTGVLAAHPDAAVVAVTNPRHRRPTVSATFHGRDVMAPAAAHLVAGVPLSDLGPPPATPPVRFAGFFAERDGDLIRGTVVRIDRFGNLITNISAAQLDGLPRERLRVRIGGGELVGLRRFYAEVPVGAPLALLGSSGRLEVAVNGGSAAEVSGVGIGAVVEVDTRGA